MHRVPANFERAHVRDTVAAQVEETLEWLRVPPANGVPAHRLTRLLAVRGPGGFLVELRVFRDSDVLSKTKLYLFNSLLYKL